ncbi:MAG: hypothetical protein GTO16_09940 [Candidatus Aminicenantes bacterium]|nr:hypothetical protein [Candidatus Aminicenantes bacterium]
MGEYYSGIVGRTALAKSSIKFRDSRVAEVAIWFFRFTEDKGRRDHESVQRRRVFIQNARDHN